MFSYYELHDFDGVSYYRWDYAATRMEFYAEGQWYASLLNPSTLAYYAEEWDGVTVNEVMAGDVK